MNIKGKFILKGEIHLQMQKEQLINKEGNLAYSKSEICHDL